MRLLFGLVILSGLCWTAGQSVALAQPPSEEEELAQVYGAYVWAYLLLLAALVAILRRPHPVAGALLTPSARPTLADAG